MKLFSAVGVCVVIQFLSTGSARAQYTANFQTNIVSGVTSNWTGNYVIGSNTFADVLIVNNGAVLDDSLGYLGYLASSSNNAAIVSGAGSIWYNSGGDAVYDALYVGYSGSGNTLTVTNGGTVYSGYSYIGEFAGASNNAVTVTGAGSIWYNNEDDNGELHVGDYGSANTLTITKGGAVINVEGYIGELVGGNSNAVTVIGVNSVWSNSSWLLVGTRGSGNTLTITNGGAVYSFGSLIGGLASASNNAVTVTGTGSVWTNNNGRINGFLVGYSGSGNTLTITNGGDVINTEGYIGGYIGGGDTNLGSVLTANTNAANNNAVTVTGAGSVWNNSSNLTVGYYGSGNTLTIVSGGTVYNAYAYIGYTNSANNNTVLVTGSGSVWDSMVDLTVGSNGKTNTLTIGTGGSVLATNAHVSYLAGAVGNRINIEGGSLMVASNVTIGSFDCLATGQITVDAGELLVTNAAHDAALEVLSGTLTLNGGTTIIDRLVITNACARFVHAGGTLIVGSYVIDQNKFRSTAVTPSSNNVLLTWMMGPGATNALQAAPGNVNGGFGTNAFTDIFVVTNNSAAGTVTNYLDVGGATNAPARYYRVRLVP